MKYIKKNIAAHLEYLCGNCFSRHCGSPSEKAAADYIEDCFTSIGLSVRREYFSVRGWRFVSFSMVNVTKGCEVRDILPCYFSGSCDVEGRLLVLDTAACDALDNIDVRGRICFVTKSDGHVFVKNAIAEKLEQLGASAVIFISVTEPGPSTKLVRSPFIDRIACASVSRVGAYELMSNITDTFRLTVDAQPFDTESCNVIASLGNGKAKGVFGGHYDTAPLLEGAGDDASGISMLIETARILKDIYKRSELPFTLDFAAFSAEEYIPKHRRDGVYEFDAFPPGSGSYIENHRCEDIRWYINLDDYGHLFSSPVYVLGNEEKLPQLDFDHPTEKTTYASDDKAFGYAGIPTIFLADRMMFRNMHTQLDTREKIDTQKLADGVMSVTDICRQLIDTKNQTT